MKIENPIGWCDETTNAVTGCDKVSPGCKNCYAATGTRARVLRSQGIETWGPKGVRHPVAQFAEKIRRLNKLCVCDVCHEAHPIGRLKEKDGTAGGTPAARCGVQRSDEYGFCQGVLRRIRLFADSNSDWLDEKWPIEVLANFLKEIHDAPNVDVLLLTKRPENFEDRLRGVVKWSEEKPLARIPNPGGMAARWLIGDAPKNVWLGVSVENQAMADLRIPRLLAIPSAVRFLSCEPLLSPLSFRWAAWEPFKQEPGGITNHLDGLRRLDWVIVGGESGADRRDCGVDAIVSVAEQCAAAGVPVYVKQDCAFKSGEQGRIPGGHLET